MIPTIGAYQARQNFGELLEEVYYKGKSFLIKRGKRPMAYLISQPQFAALMELIEKDQALADTLAILANPQIRRIIERGGEDVVKGRTYPIKSILEK